MTPLAVELGEHVVEQKEWRLPPALERQAGFSKDESEDGDPLLTLRAEAPELAAGGSDAHVAEVWSGAREAPLDVSLEPLGELQLGQRARVVRQSKLREPEGFAGGLEAR